MAEESLSVNHVRPDNVFFSFFPGLADDLMRLLSDTQMIQCATMTEKLIRWETSGRRSSWVPSAPAPALEDSRYDPCCDV